MLFGQSDHFIKPLPTAEKAVVDRAELWQQGVQCVPLPAMVGIQGVVVVPTGFMWVKLEEFFEGRLHVRLDFRTSPVILRIFRFEVSLKINVGIQQH